MAPKTVNEVKIFRKLCDKEYNNILRLVNAMNVSENFA
jgi:hypothetical protein